jgi:GTP cyclohydrolase I
MTMRGVRTPGAVTVTSVVRGLFRKRAATRAEAMSLIFGSGRR